MLCLAAPSAQRMVSAHTDSLPLGGLWGAGAGRAPRLLEEHLQLRQNTGTWQQQTRLLTLKLGREEICC